MKTFKLFLLYFTLLISAGCATTKNLKFDKLENQYLNQTIYYTETKEKYIQKQLSPEEIDKFVKFSAYYFRAKDWYVYFIVNRDELSPLETYEILYNLDQQLQWGEKYKT
jgi:hypothetical protein